MINITNAKDSEKRSASWSGLEKFSESFVWNDGSPHDMCSINATDEFNSGQLIIADGCSFSLDDYSTNLNNNVLIVGGSGTGKTRKIVTPNIKEAVGSYFICDPKGQLY